MGGDEAGDELLLNRVEQDEIGPQLDDRLQVGGEEITHLGQGGDLGRECAEPVDAHDSTDWLIVGVVTARAGNGAAAAARWAEQRGALPWEDVRADLEIAARRIADEFRSAAHRIATPTETVSTSSRATLREADRAAIRSGLAETAREPGRHERPKATLRAVEAWGWLWWLADDLSRLDGETTSTAAPASTATT